MKNIESEIQNMSTKINSNNTNPETILLPYLLSNK